MENNLNFYSFSQAFPDIGPNYNGTNDSGHDIEIYKPLSSAGEEHFKLDSNADKYRHWDHGTENGSSGTLSEALSLKTLW